MEHAVEKAHGLRAGFQDAAADFDPVSLVQFAAVGQMLVEGRHPAMMLTHESGIDPHHPEEHPGRLVEHAHMVLHVHVPHVVQVPGIHDALAGYGQVTHGESHSWVIGKRQYFGGQRCGPPFHRNGGAEREWAACLTAVQSFTRHPDTRLSPHESSVFPYDACFNTSKVGNRGSHRFRRFDWEPLRRRRATAVPVGCELSGKSGQICAIGIICGS